MGDWDRPAGARHRDPGARVSRPAVRAHAPLDAVRAVSWCSTGLDRRPIVRSPSEMDAATRRAVLVRVRRPDPERAWLHHRSFCHHDDATKVSSLSSSGTIVELGDLVVVLTSVHVLLPFLKARDE